MAEAREAPKAVVRAIFVSGAAFALLAVAGVARTIATIGPAPSASVAPARLPDGTALAPGDRVEPITDDARADWSGEAAYKAGCTERCARMQFDERTRCGGPGCVVATSRDGFVTTTAYRNLYLPASALRRASPR